MRILSGVMTTLPHHGPGSRRVVPPALDEAQRSRLQALLDDPDTWVLRPSWEPFLLHGDDAVLVDTALLTRDQCIAALAWLRQQRHPLHDALHGGKAPDGWLESVPLVERLEALIAARPATSPARGAQTTRPRHRPGQRTRDSAPGTT